MLRDEIVALTPGLGRLADGLRYRLGYAAARIERVHTLCQAGRLPRARAVLRAALRRVQTSLAKVRARSAREAIAPGLDTSLERQLEAMEADVKALLDGLSCP